MIILNIDLSLEKFRSIVIFRDVRTQMYCKPNYILYIIIPVAIRIIYWGKTFSKGGRNEERKQDIELVVNIKINL